MTAHQAAAGIAPGGGSLVLSLALLLWAAFKTAYRFTAWFDRHSGDHPHHLQEDPVTDPRPRPLRTAASVIGGLTALITGLVGAGLLTPGQGDGITGLITAVVVALAHFGVVVATEQRVTPLIDPRDAQGRPLTPAEDTD